MNNLTDLKTKLIFQNNFFSTLALFAIFFFSLNTQAQDISGYASVTYTFVGPGADWNTASNWSPASVPSNTNSASGTIIIINANATVSEIIVKSGVTLTVNSPAILTVGNSGNSGTNQVLDFNNGCTVNINTGASLVVNGLLNNSNNSNGITFNGAVSVSGNISSGTGANISGSGTIASSGTITGSGSVFGTTDQCSTGPCFASQPGGVVGCTSNSPASVTISASPADAICNGTSVTFTATPGNGGTAPTYQWKLNGNNVGTNSSSYTNAALANSDIVSCVMTSNAACVTTNQATKSITMTVNALPTTPTIVASGSTTFCSGGNVTLTSSAATSYLWSTGATTQSITVSAAGSYSVKTTNASGCQSAASAPTTVTVTATNTAGAASSSPTVCANSALTNILHITTGATGLGTATGLPTGVSASWSANTITISGTPTVAGTYNYSIPLSGGCGTVYAAGTIIVNSNNTVSAASAQPNICNNNQALPNFFHSTTGATGIGSATGLPTGVTATWSANTITIGGSTTQTGVFNYSIPLTGGCGNANATGTITINTLPSVTGITISQPAVICANSTATFSIPAIAGATSYEWSAAGTGWEVTAGANSTTATITIGSDMGMVYVTATNACGTSEQITTDVLTPTTPLTPIASSKVQPTCSVSTGSVTLSNLPSGNWTINPGNISGSGLTYPITGLAAGTYKFTVTNASGCTSAQSSAVVINAVPNTPSTPIVGIITQPTASVITGSVVLSGLPSGGTINPGNITYAGTAATITNLTPGIYNYTVTNTSGCISAISNDIVILQYIDPNDKKWNGPLTGNWFDTNSWSPNGIPTSSSNVTIPANYTITVSSPTNAIAYANKLTVLGGGQLDVLSAHTLIVTDKVTAQGTFNLNSGASLIQINDTANSGIINVYRDSAKLALNDYTYWSAPTFGSQTLYNFSPNSNPKYFLTYENTWSYLNASTTTFTPGLGYGIIAPKGSNGTSKSFKFTGTPNNGPVSMLIGSGSVSSPSYKLVGNPYPSALDADAFINANINVVSSLYFWSHNTPMSNGSYSSTDYSVYNLGGAVPNSSATKLWIASGQGFIVETKAAGSIDFNNSMRAIGTEYTNANFYKNTNNANSKTALEKNRIWLNLTNGSSNFSQTLIGYVQTATNDYDSAFDAGYFSSNKTGIYSLMGNNNYTIQSKALPFNQNDIVPLGYTTDVRGNSTISIDSVDGLFANGQNIFIEDKMLNVVHNLKTSSYTFETEIGTFNNRFVLRYTSANALGLNDDEEVTNDVIITSKNQQIKINSANEPIEKIFVYDVLGKKIYQNTSVLENEIMVSNFNQQQILIVKVILADGQSVTKKVAY